mmetsp:Transcript_26268/g.42945  ORF Transcript_26268/g.42945 Transcript_26268/m.42945 type:complete len:212 (+) Transcript_26268:636-1271(+)
MIIIVFDQSMLLKIVQLIREFGVQHIENLNLYRIDHTNRNLIAGVIFPSALEYPDTADHRQHDRDTENHRREREKDAQPIFEHTAMILDNIAVIFRHHHFTGKGRSRHLSLMIAAHAPFVPQRGFFAIPYLDEHRTPNHRNQHKKRTPAGIDPIRTQLDDEPNTANDHHRQHGLQIMHQKRVIKRNIFAIIFTNIVRDMRINWRTNPATTK